MRARGSAAAGDRQRRRRIQRRAARPQRPARQRLAQQRSAGTAAHAHGGGRGTHSPSKRVHWPSHLGSAFTFVAVMYLPRTARACGPRPPRTNGRTWSRTGPKPWKVAAHALNTHPHARDRHTDAFGAAIVPCAATARPHARLDAAPEYMYLNIDGCQSTLYI